MISSRRTLHEARDLSQPGMKDWPSAGINVIGVGAGVYDRLSETGLDVAPLNASEQLGTGRDRRR